MNLLDKNNWLNLVLGLFGFYFVYSVCTPLIGRYGTETVITQTRLNANYYWLVAFVLALLLGLALVILFCKPRAPLFVAVGILAGAVLVLHGSLFEAVVNLDRYFRQEGLAAGTHLIPHLVVLLGVGIAYFGAQLSNGMGKH